MELIHCECFSVNWVHKGGILIHVFDKLKWEHVFRNEVFQLKKKVSFALRMKMGKKILQKESDLGKIIVEGTLQVGCPISENFIIISIRQKNDKQ
jgi:hypothetical protein